MSDLNCPVCGRDAVSRIVPAEEHPAETKVILVEDPDHCLHDGTRYFHEANVEIEVLHGWEITVDTERLGEGDSAFFGTFYEDQTAGIGTKQEEDDDR